MSLKISERLFLNKKQWMGKTIIITVVHMRAFFFSYSCFFTAVKAEYNIHSSCFMGPLFFGREFL